MINIAAVTVSSPEIGMGHLTRSVQLLSLLDESIFNYEIIGENYSLPSWINNFKHTFTKLNNIDISSLNKFDIVIFDSYIHRDILENITSKIILIDDFNHLGSTKADIVIDYNYGSSEDLYPEDVELLLSPDYFPISENTFPEYYKDSPSKFDKDGEILLSFGGVSDKKLIDIKEQIQFYEKFGDIILMDPLGKLNEFKPYVKNLIQYQSLSDVFSSRKIKFCKIAGGTSKYIAMAYKIPIIYVYRNDLEKFLIDKFKQNDLCLLEEDLDEYFNENLLSNKLIELNNKYFKLFSFDKGYLINKKFKSLIN